MSDHGWKRTPISAIDGLTDVDFYDDHDEVQDDSIRCMCPLCECLNRVVGPGYVCDECRSGGHQG